MLVSWLWLLEKEITTLPAYATDRIEPPPCFSTFNYEREMLHGNGAQITEQV
jgi:hypothetical protein